jgi:class 3 adenylate cyclase/predicted Ser/Thr protein kinase
MGFTTAGTFVIHDRDEFDSEALSMTDQPSGATGLLLKDRYRVEKVLGKGGIGIVYLARDEHLLSRPVVIKVLLEQSTESDWLQKKFRGEIEALVRIDHPGVVGALDSGAMPDGKPFLVMQFVQGVTLRALVQQAGGLLALPEVGTILRQVGSALSAAHEKGVHHRDLKPENIMVQDLGHDQKLVKIIDFGIATVRDPAEQATQHTQVAGSVLYMAPEQLEGRPSAASDIYALAVIAYELLTGRPPFEPKTPYELLMIQREGVKEPPSRRRPGLSPALDAVVLKGLALDPKDRYASAREFAEEVARTLLAEAPTRPPEGVQETVIVHHTGGASGAVALAPQPLPTGGGKPTQVPGPTQPGPPPTVIPPPTGVPASTLEMAHVLFMDIVGYSRLPMDHQRDVLATLQGIVQGTAEYQSAHAGRTLVSLPTGDGMALVFFGDPTMPLLCAVDVAKALRAQPQIKLRMGIHTGPVYRVADINANLNVAGGGINIAQRVMDCGDAGHILVSRAVADVVDELSQWQGTLRDLGTHPVKHGVQVHLFNLVTPEVGHADVPSKLRRAGPSVTPHPRAEPPRSRLGLYAGIGVVAAGAVAGVYFGVIRKPEPTPGTSPSTTTTLPAPPPVGRELSYYVTVQRYLDGRKADGEPFRLAREMLFDRSRDYGVRLTVVVPKEGYLYVVNQGPQPRDGLPSYNVLFPSVTTPGRSAFIAAGQEVAVPRDTGWLNFDKETGTETLWIVSSPREIPELEAVKHLVNPEDRGAVKDPGQIDGVGRVLALHQKDKPKPAPDEETKRTILRAQGETLVGVVKLEHQ